MYETNVYKPKEGGSKEINAKQDNNGLLMKIIWPEEKIFDDGKQSDTLTGASHPGCCKQ